MKTRRTILDRNLFHKQATSAALLSIAALGTLIASTRAASDVQPNPPTTPAAAAAVTLPYAEFRALMDAVERAKAPPGHHAPPVAAAILSARYEIDCGERPIGKAAIDLALPGDGWKKVPLLDARLPLLGVEPPEAILVVEGGMLCLASDHQGSQSLSLIFDAADLADLQGTLRFRLPPAASSSIAIRQPPDRGRVVVEGAARASGDGRYAVPPTGGDVAVKLLTGKSAPPPLNLPRVETDLATIAEASYETKLVSDGALLCAAKVRVEHREPIRWRFSLPEGGRLLSATVGGTRQNPFDAGDGALEVDLPAPPASKSAGELSTEVLFTFTQQLAKLDPVEGRAALALPATPLFIHVIRWTVELPPGYAATAIDSDLELADAGGPGKPLLLVKRLCRDTRPSAALFYRRADLN